MHIKRSSTDGLYAFGNHYLLELAITKSTAANGCDTFRNGKVSQRAQTECATADYFQTVRKNNFLQLRTFKKRTFADCFYAFRDHHFGKLIAPDKGFLTYFRNPFRNYHFARISLAAFQNTFSDHQCMGISCAFLFMLHRNCFFQQLLLFRRCDFTRIVVM